MAKNEESIITDDGTLGDTLGKKKPGAGKLSAAIAGNPHDKMSGNPHD